MEHNNQSSHSTYRTMDPFSATLVVLILTGIIAGLLAGMLGVGGGFLMVPVMFILLSDLGYSDYAMDIAVATSVAVILPTALSGTWRQWKKKNIVWRPALILGAGGIFGSIIGSYISIILSASTHTIIFGIFLIIIAVWMTVQRCDMICHFTIPGSVFNFIILGVCTGIASGLFGIGGGIILTPVLATIIGFGMHKAVGIATTSMVLTATGATSAYIMHGWNMSEPLFLSVGFVNIPFWVALCATSIPAAQIGVLFSHKTPEHILRYIFIVMLLAIAIKMIW